MMRFLLLLALMPFALLANIDIFPKKECELFNNMKHTKNRGHQTVSMNHTYEMLKHHKEQYLVKVEGATPVQRWVSDDCFSLRPLRGTPLYGQSKKQITPKKELTVEKKKYTNTKKYDSRNNYKKSYQKRSGSGDQNLLVLSWHNAFCESHKYKKECKRGILSALKSKYADKHFILHGLWPQPRSKMYCGVNSKNANFDKRKQWNRLPNLGLDSDTKKSLLEVMPGMRSNLHKHEWFKHGTCYGGSADDYYDDAIALVHQVNDSKVGKFFEKNIGKTVTLKQVRHLFDTSFGTGAGKHVEMKCNRGLLTELWLHIGTGSDNLSELFKKGKTTRSRCQKGRIDRAGFGR